MKGLLVAAIIMAGLIGTQMVAEARGGAGGGGMSSGSGSMTRMQQRSMNTNGADFGTRTQSRLRDQSHLGDSAAGNATGDQLHTRQQLRDPSLHTLPLTTTDTDTLN